MPEHCGIERDIRDGGGEREGERERAEGLDSLSKVRPVISKYP